METALPVVQPVADKHGFGEPWRRMCDERTMDAAELAKEQAGEYIDDAYAAANYAFQVLYAAGQGWVFAYSARRAACAGRASAAVVGAGMWTNIDPVGLLERLVAVGAEVTEKLHEQNEHPG